MLPSWTIATRMRVNGIRSCTQSKQFTHNWNSFWVKWKIREAPLEHNWVEIKTLSLLRNIVIMCLSRGPMTHEGKGNLTLQCTHCSFYKKIVCISMQMSRFCFTDMALMVTIVWDTEMYSQWASSFFWLTSLERRLLWLCGAQRNGFTSKRVNFRDFPLFNDTNRTCLVALWFIPESMGL